MERILPENASFDWDEANVRHISRHSVVPEEAEEVFYHEPQIITYDDSHSDKETRYSFLGQTRTGRWLTIIFTLRGKNKEKIRIISARDQSKKERKTYNDEIKKGSDDLI